MKSKQYKSEILIINGMPKRYYHLTCSVCGKEFLWTNAVKKFCSDGCAANVAPKAFPERACQWCGEMFTPTKKDQKYCCVEHRTRYNNCMRDRSEVRAKAQMVKRFSTAIDIIIDKHTKKKPDPGVWYSEAYPDGCVFVHTSSSGGYWKKGVVENVVG